MCKCVSACVCMCLCIQVFIYRCMSDHVPAQRKYLGSFSTRCIFIFIKNHSIPAFTIPQTRALVLTAILTFSIVALETPTSQTFIATLTNLCGRSGCMQPCSCRQKSLLYFGRGRHSLQQRNSRSACMEMSGGFLL